MNLSKLRYEQRQQQREEERAAEAEAEREAEAGRRRAEEEQYAAWRGAFGVEGAGHEAFPSAEAEDEALAALAAHLAAEGSTELSALPAAFPWLPARDVRRRIAQLEERGAVSGVFDHSRGRYVHVSRAQMEEIARAVRERGRLSVAELSRECARVLSS